MGPWLYSLYISLMCAYLLVGQPASSTTISMPFQGSLFFHETLAQSPFSWVRPQGFLKSCLPISSTVWIAHLSLPCVGCCPLIQKKGVILHVPKYLVLGTLTFHCVESVIYNQLNRQHIYMMTSCCKMEWQE